METPATPAKGDVVSPVSTRRLGTTTIALSELGFGGAPLGNLFHEVSDADADATVRAALAAGVRYIDTAPYYGLGLSETRLGRMVVGRDDLVISTKVGRLLVPDRTVTGSADRFGFRTPMPYAPVFDYRHDAILRSHRESLARLGAPRIDILYIHDIGRLTHGERHEEMWRQLVDEGGLDALEQLRAEGTIGAFGIGVNEVEACLDLLEIARPDVILLAGRYTLLEQHPLDDLFPACEQAGISIVAGGPYNSGILAHGTRGGRSLRFDYLDAPSAIVERVAAIQAIADRHDIPLAAAALQFPLAHPLVASVIPGLETPAQVAQTMRWHAIRIPGEFWSDLKRAGLLHEAAPTPGDEP